MSFLRPVTQTDSTVAVPRAGYGRWERLRTRVDRLVDAGAERPLAATFAVLGLNVVLGAIFIAIGEALFADPAELFRELMPGTWLSFAELLFIAAVALAIQLETTGSRRVHLDNLWGLSAVIFLVFAVDEITQATIFIADALGELGALAPGGFKDLDSFLLAVLFLAAAAAMLRFAGQLLAHPPALALFAVAVLLGAGSQTLDSLVPATQSEFVAEESLKLAAEAFLIGGYLLILQRVRRRRTEPAPD
jgi:hypothetical protein